MTTWTAPFGPASLRIDPEQEVSKVSASLSAYLARSKRRGIVVALSGGIDSSTVAALCVAALGKDRVFGLHMPERESSPETIMLSRLVAESLGINSVLEDISPILEGADCYRRRDDAIRTVCPGYGPGYKSKIVLPSVIDSDSFRLFSVVVMAPDGTQTKHRLTAGRLIWASSPRPTSSSACARCWSTTTRTGSTTPSRGPRTGWNTIRASS